MIYGTSPYRGTTAAAGRSFGKTVDWVIVLCYLALVLFGWMNIYASVHGDEPTSIFAWGWRSGKQFVWILTSLGIAGIIMFLIPPKAYQSIAPAVYAATLILLVAVIFIGSSVKGSNSWFTLGPVRFQPAEISKIATSLMLASIMSRPSFKLSDRKDFLTVAATILLPMLIIVCEKETGSALVYVGFIFMLYREGLSGWLIALLGLAILLFIVTLVGSPFVGLLVLSALISLYDCIFDGKVPWWLAIGLPVTVGLCFLPETHHLEAMAAVTAAYGGFSIWRSLHGRRQEFRLFTLATLLGGVLLVFSTQFIFDHVLQDHQRSRIEVLLGMKEDLSGLGYNVHQSKIAIGSGGFWGKGYCCGTQTAYGFVPEQSTDFIFCTVGEEWGFVGCLGVIALYCILIWRLIRDSERSRERFTRVYGYCTACCLFMHLFINVGMTLGMMPVIGIPLPLMSYGGSSLWAFTTMLFIFVALDRNERKYFT